MRVTVLASLVLCACGPDPGRAAAPVVGGVPSAEPAVGALFFEGVFEGDGVALVGCSATLVAPDVVLTAAHCFDPYVIDMVWLPRFTLDDDTASPTARWYDVAETVVHEEAAATEDLRVFLERPNDVALAFLAEPVVGVTPMPIATPEASDAIVVDRTLTLIGYGQTTVGDDATRGRERSLATRVSEVGEAELRHLASETSCAGVGDSGGPLLGDLDGTRRVIGITSHGGAETLDCSAGGDIAERVDVYAGWITSNAPSVCEATPDACPTPPDAGGCAVEARRGGSAGWVALLALAGALTLRSRRSRRLTAPVAGSLLAACGAATPGAGDASMDARVEEIDAGADAGRVARRVCDWCVSDDQCAAGTRCVHFVDEWSACLPICDPEAPVCPAGAGCAPDDSSCPRAMRCERRPEGAVCVPNETFACCADLDGDGLGTGDGCPGSDVDCDDGDPLARVAFSHDACDGHDGDCDGVVDEGAPSDALPEASRPACLPSCTVLPDGSSEAVAAGRCSDGVCEYPAPESCGPYACARAAAAPPLPRRHLPYCGTGCDDDRACAEGARCEGGSCT